jgi:formyltetrahydrofolate deformylase
VIATEPTATAPVDEAAHSDVGRLLVQGDDRPGIVAGIARVLATHGANIETLDQFSTDPDGGRFFQRTVFRLPELGRVRPELEASLSALGADLDIDWSLSDAGRRKRVAILASTTDHCLLDLLWRQRRGEIAMDIEMVISNHSVLASDVASFGVPFRHVPVEGPEGKTAAEQAHLELLAGRVDLVVLARYMQIISGSFLQRVGVPVINIHHSFLPAFIGAGPYKKAKERGVKLIGATAHYVTEDLDEGPIIEQDVVRVSHADSASDLQRRGADVERHVLSRAVGWHCDDRVMRFGNSTIVF